METGIQIDKPVVNREEEMILYEKKILVWNFKTPTKH